MKKTLCIFTLSLLSSLSLADVAVVVGKSSSATKLSREQVQDIFLAKKSSLPNGSTAIPLDNKDASVKEAFNNNVLDKTNAQVKSYWAKLIFTGKGTPPKEVANSDEVKKLVSTNPNTIGYIDKSHLDTSVKVIYE